MAVQNISYNDKTDLNSTSVPDANKVKASDLNEVKTVVNNNATELSSTQTLLDNNVNYSISSEKLVGTTSAGKPMYMKILTIGSLPNTTYATYNTGISNLDVMEDIRGKAKNTSNGNLFPLPFVGDVDTGNIEMVFLGNDNKIRITTRSNRTSLSAEIYMYYSKTS